MTPLTIFLAISAAWVIVLKYVVQPLTQLHDVLADKIHSQEMEK